jgi:hypothetical protein
MGFEPTFPAFERVKTFHALDRAATVISSGAYGFQCYDQFVKDPIHADFEREVGLFDLETNAVAGCWQFITPVRNRLSTDRSVGHLRMLLMTPTI